jgi:hypothetical protein
MWNCAECGEENKDEYKLCQSCCADVEAVFEEQKENDENGSEDALRIPTGKKEHKYSYMEFTKMPPVGVKLRNFSYTIIIIFILLGIVLFALGMEARIPASILIGIIAVAGLNVWVLCIALSGIAEIIRNTNATRMIALWNLRKEQEKVDK